MQEWNYRTTRFFFESIVSEKFIYKCYRLDHTSSTAKIRTVNLAEMFAVLVLYAAHSFPEFFSLMTRKTTQCRREGFWRPGGINHFGAFPSPSFFLSSPFLISSGLRNRPINPARDLRERYKLPSGAWGDCGVF